MNQDFLTQQWDFDATAETSSLACELVETYLRNNLVPQRCVLIVNLIIEELFLNTLKHGTTKDPAKRVTIEVNTILQDLQVTFRDNCHEFDITQQTQNSDVEEIGGKGIQLIRGLVERVHYRRDCGWNTNEFLVNCRAMNAA